MKMITLAGGSPHPLALHTWFREAGLDPARMIKSTSTTSYSTPEKRKWWAQLHKERIEKSDVREKFLEAGVTEEQLACNGAGDAGSGGRCRRRACVYSV
jgi:hypothetical protein